MTKFKKIMVGLDLTKTDRNVVKYASFICRKLKPEVVHFVHVKKPYTIPLILNKRYPDTLEELTRKMLGELNKVVRENFTFRGVKKEITLLEGSPLQELLSFSHKKKIDLIVVGRKGKEGGVIPEKLSRKSNCSVLFVPERAKPDLSKIHVPMDLSEHSKIALDTAEQLTGTSKGSTIFCQNVLYFPVYPVSLGNTKSEFTGEVSEELQDNMVKFIDKYGKGNSKFEVIFSFDDFNEPYKHILGFAGKKKPDLMVIGSRGMTSAAAVFMGSVAEKLIRHNRKIPMLIVKRKGENSGLFKMWFGK